jgi:DNA invertase Pin-like site-specific DNA recombinase
MHVLMAVAEFEREIIRERTKAGLRSAKAEGRIGGNPGLEAGDPVAIRKAKAALVESHFQKLNAFGEL